MNPSDKGQIEMLEKLLYTAFEKRLSEVAENAPHAIDILRTNTTEIFDELNNRLEALHNMDELTVESLLNLCMTYFMQALIFSVANDSFFEES